MAKIKDRKKGRQNGGYTRLFGIDELGALISQIHATSISAGTELEKLVCKSHTNLMTKEMFSEFINKRLPNGTYLIPKKLIKDIIKIAIGSQSEPDFIVIIIVDTKAYVVELKDGDTFDTKKSEGEVASCREFAKLFTQYLIQMGLNYTVEIRICSFNQNSKDEIVAGFKNRITKSEAWTGTDFCKVLGISYQSLVQQRQTDQETNLEYFVESLVAINRVREMLTAKMRV